MQTLKAYPPCPLSDSSAGPSSALQDATHVFVRHNAVCKPLQPPYDGPYKVLDRSANYFTLDINGRTDTITLGRLKPAYLEGNPVSTDSSLPPVSTPIPSQTQPPTETTSSREDVPTPTESLPTRMTRSGRRVHWPTHLADYFAH